MRMNAVLYKILNSEFLERASLAARGGVGPDYNGRVRRSARVACTG